MKSLKLLLSVVLLASVALGQTAKRLEASANYDINCPNCGGNWAKVEMDASNASGDHNDQPDENGVWPDCSFSMATVGTGTAYFGSKDGTDYKLVFYDDGTCKIWDISGSTETLAAEAEYKKTSP